MTKKFTLVHSEADTDTARAMMFVFHPANLCVVVVIVDVEETEFVRCTTNSPDATNWP